MPQPVLGSQFECQWQYSAAIWRRRLNYCYVNENPLRPLRGEILGQNREHNSEGVYATRRWPRQLRAVALQTTLQPIAASAFAVVYLPKADTSNTSYDTYVGIVNLNGFVQLQPVRFINMAAVNGTDSHVHA